MTRLVTLGEALGLFRGTEVGDLTTQSDFRLSIGGAEANVAIGVARLGGDAVWLGRVGTDSLGRRVVRDLRGEGVTVVAIPDDSAPTGLMIKEKLTPGSTRVAFYRRGSAGSRLAEGDIPEDFLVGAGVAHVTGISLAVSDSAARAIHGLVERAGRERVPVSFDVNHRPSLWSSAEDAADAYRSVASRARMVFAGADEAALLVGEGSPAEQAQRIADLGPTEVVIKLGDRGCVALVEGTLLTAPAFAVKVVDTVGAGDAFVAGYIAEWLLGRSAESRIETATRAGAFACLGAGDWETNARRDDLHLLDAPEPVSR